MNSTAFTPMEDCSVALPLAGEVAHCDLCDEATSAGVRLIDAPPKGESGYTSSAVCERCAEKLAKAWGALKGGSLRVLILPGGDANVLPMPKRA